MQGKEISSKIKALRHEKGFSQQGLAKLCGLTASCYSNIENGKMTPNVKIIKSIAGQLGVPITFLLDDRIGDAEQRVAIEEDRLRNLFSDIPNNQMALAEGLITQAARLKILLDDNWKDIIENGEYEKFRQSENQVPYDRKRPIVESYDNRDKTYQSIINQLTGLLNKGPRDKKSKLSGR